jgi:hypothetical protein
MELALKGLEAERRRVDEEIAELQGRLRGGAPKPSASSTAATRPATRKRGRLTAAGRKAISDAMKRRWAERRKAQAKK